MKQVLQPLAMYHQSCARLDSPPVWHSPGDCRDTIHKLGSKDNIGIVEHALLQGHHYELRVGEVGLDHPPNILSMAQIQCSVNLQDTHHLPL